MTNTPLLTRLYLAKLGVDHAYALVHSTVELATQASLHLDPLTRQAAQHMADCNAALETNLKTMGQQEYTRQIRTLDQQCGRQWAAIKRSVKYYGQDGTPAQQAAAKEWALFLQPYGHLPQAALNTQMALLLELLDKYLASTTLRKAAEVLGLQERILSLQSINEALVLTYRQRNIRATARTRTNTQLKMESLAAYRRFCALLEQACLYTGSEPLLALIAQLNGYRTKYQTIIARRQTNRGTHTEDIMPTEASVQPALQDTPPAWQAEPSTSNHDSTTHQAAGTIPAASAAMAIATPTVTTAPASTQGVGYPPVVRTMALAPLGSTHSRSMAIQTTVQQIP